MRTIFPATSLLTRGHDVVGNSSGVPLSFGISPSISLRVISVGGSQQVTKQQHSGVSIAILRSAISTSDPTRKAL